jgi:hypothetical protein
MAHHESYSAPRPLERALETAYDRFPGWKETDMQFQVGRIEGAPVWGLDIVHDHKRLLIAEGSNTFSERLIKQKMGPGAVLKSSKTGDGLVIYNVPQGSRLLVKTFRQAPYTRPYMDKLAVRSGNFLRDLSRLDPGLFGITIERIAITHDGGEGKNDDTELTVVPPLLAPDEAQPVSMDEIVRQASLYFQEGQIEKLIDGLNGV